MTTTEPDPPVPPHLLRTRTLRGFTHLPPLPSVYGGNVRVYESSAAEAPRVWLTATAPVDLNDPTGPRLEVPIHLEAVDAWRLAEQLVSLCVGHYHGDVSPPAAERSIDLVLKEDRNDDD